VRRNKRGKRSAVRVTFHLVRLIDVNYFP
jgi:hypothetical protein